MFGQLIGRLGTLILMVSLVLFCAVFLPTPAHAAATIDKAFKAPTARKNGDPLAASEIAGYQAYRDGVASGAALPAAATKITIPACVKATYTLTVTDTSGLVSDVSDPYALVPDGGCAPGKAVWVP